MCLNANFVHVYCVSFHTQSLFMNIFSRFFCQNEDVCILQSLHRLLFPSEVYRGCKKIIKETSRFSRLSPLLFLKLSWIRPHDAFVSVLLLYFGTHINKTVFLILVVLFEVLGSNPTKKQSIFYLPFGHMIALYDHTEQANDWDWNK